MNRKSEEILHSSVTSTRDLLHCRARRHPIVLGRWGSPEPCSRSAARLCCDAVRRMMAVGGVEAKLGLAIKQGSLQLSLPLLLSRGDLLQSKLRNQARIHRVFLTSRILYMYVCLCVYVLYVIIQFGVYFLQ